jgi:hypothetical protein
MFPSARGLNIEVADPDGCADGSANWAASRRSAATGRAERLGDGYEPAGAASQLRRRLLDRRFRSDKSPKTALVSPETSIDRTTHGCSVERTVSVCNRPRPAPFRTREWTGDLANKREAPKGTSVAGSSLRPRPGVQETPRRRLKHRLIRGASFVSGFGERWSRSPCSQCQGSRQSGRNVTGMKVSTSKKNGYISIIYLGMGELQIAAQF